MKNTFLFDLDGTVLPMDFDKFMELYFYNLGVYFHGKIDPILLAKYIMEATEVMIKDKSEIKNTDIFMNHFASLIDDDIEEYKEMFNSFYDSLFENVKASTYESEYMRKSIDLLKEKGYQVVIATNPLFPLKANYHRLRWAGFTPDEFSYITSFEQNRYCKPHIEFYEEVLGVIGKTPSECTMVGNDVFDDLTAGKIGIETYLITNHLLNKYNQDYKADKKGTYEEFYQYITTLEDIN
jgi:FMN phosphatase YigB (HAD superfamily)